MLILIGEKNKNQINGFPTLSRFTGTLILCLDKQAMEK